MTFGPLRRAVNHVGAVVALNLYRVLGLKKDATVEAIKTAYRTLAKTRHPDVGGSIEKWRILQLAYRVLSDEDARQRYDQEGTVEEPAPENDRELGEVISFLNQIITALIIADNSTLTPYDDLRAVILDVIDKEHGERSKAFTVIRAREKRIRRVNRRWRRKTFGQVDYIRALFDQNLEALCRKRADIKKQLALIERARDLVADYEFIPAKRKPEPKKAAVTVTVKTSAAGVKGGTLMEQEILRMMGATFRDFDGRS